MSRRPNILIITTDQQHHAMMSGAGNRYLHTPAMDRIASWGTRFTRAYCADPVCVPSRFCWWTGRMPSAIGMSSNGAPRNPDGSRLLVDEPVHRGALGHVLRDAGYTTAFAGKQHTPGGLTAESMGFANLTDDQRDRCAVECARFIRREHDRPWALAANFINPHDICYMAIRDFPRTDMDHAILRNGDTEMRALDEALRLPDGMSEETFFAEHCPPLPDNFEIQRDEPASIRRVVEERPFKALAREHWGEREWRLHRWAYHRLTERVDAQIGVVLDALERSGALEDTVIICTSDHGDHDGSHKLEHKTVCYDEAARVPLIIAQPGTTPAAAVEELHLAQNGIDLMATCCDYAGIAQPAHNLGHSLRPLAEARRVDDWRAGVYVESQLGHCYVTRTRKYCRYDSAGIEEQLYDLERDPGETRSVHRDSAERAALAQARQSLAKERAAHEAVQLELSEQC